LVTLLALALPADAAITATVWILGDSNSGGIYVAYQRLFAARHPEWTVVNQAISGTDSSFGLAHAVDLLAHDSPPDIAVVTYGGADLIGAIFDDPQHHPALEQPVGEILGRLLEICAAFATVRTRCVLGASVGAFDRQHPDDPRPLTPEEIATLRHLDDGYSALGRMVKQTWRTMIDFRLPREPDLWSSGSLGYIHASNRGYAIAARRLVRQLEKLTRSRR